MADKYCLIPHCPNIAKPGSSFCEEHQPPHKIANPFYLSKRWRRFRAWYLGTHPLCVKCEAEGRATLAVILDHVVELSDGGAELDVDNVQGLCAACHNRKTAEMRKNRRKCAIVKPAGSAKDSYFGGPNG